MVYQISVFTTEELYNYCKNTFNDGFRAQKRAANHIEGAITEAGFTPELHTPSDQIPAPTEESDQSFSTQCPCTPTDTC